jgi:hypothetical protein
MHAETFTWIMQLAAKALTSSRISHEQRVFVETIRSQALAGTIRSLSTTQTEKLDKIEEILCK